MKEICRRRYIDQLIAKRENGMIKVIAGIRRGGENHLCTALEKPMRANVSRRHWEGRANAFLLRNSEFL